MALNSTLIVGPSTPLIAQVQKSLGDDKRSCRRVETRLALVAAITETVFRFVIAEFPLPDLMTLGELVILLQENCASKPLLPRIVVLAEPTKLTPSEAEKIGALLIPLPFNEKLLLATLAQFEKSSGLAMW